MSNEIIVAAVFIICFALMLHGGGLLIDRALKQRKEQVSGEETDGVTPEGKVKKKKKNTPEDMVNSPNHYTSGSIECIDGIEASVSAEAFKGYCKGAALKYLWRYERKGKSLEDLKKAQWYLNKLIAVVEDE
jgi:hypothetical protein